MRAEGLSFTKRKPGLEQSKTLILFVNSNRRKRKKIRGEVKLELSWNVGSSVAHILANFSQVREFWGKNCIYILE